jgi:integrase
MKPNGKNERIKREYARYLRDARQQSETSIDGALASIARFEAYSGRRDFARFRSQHASGFKDYLDTELHHRTKKPLSAATQLQVMNALKAYFIWLADQPTYRRNIRYCDAGYFSLSLKQVAIARADRTTEGPSIDQVRHVLNRMSNDTDVEKRDRALIAFALVSGARDNAIASLRLKHINIEDGRIMQDARDVRTKRSKTIESWFFPVGADLLAEVADWVRFLKSERQWGPDDPLFPKTLIVADQDRGFVQGGLQRECWSNATPIRRIFKDACEKAGLPYFNPHSLRKTLVRFGQERCATPEQFKAWSQNLGHENVLTTFTSYGQVDRLRQRTILREVLVTDGEAPTASQVFSPEMVAAVMKALAAKPANAALPETSTS